MTDKLTPEAVKAALEAATPGPWRGHNMVHADRGDQMTPEEIGEYVCNSVRIGDQTRFLFVSGKHEDGHDVDVCHTGNGPRGPHNTRLISMAPDLATAYLAAMEENEREQRHAEQWMLAARVMEQKLSLMAEENERLRKRVKAADELAAWAEAIFNRKANQLTGGRLVLERDIVGLETSLAAYRATEKEK